jgi:hypothetical protein
MTRQIKGLKSNIFTFHFLVFRPHWDTTFILVSVNSQALKEHLQFPSPSFPAGSLESARSFALDC